ncbi:MAG: hypothetical protein ACJ71Q_00180 [Terriglobales bacterium]
MSQKRKTTTARQDKKKPQRRAPKTDSGEFWIDPDLNRKIAGPGGNRGEHTTSAAKLLELADIALKKDA